MVPKYLSAFLILLSFSCGQQKGNKNIDMAKAGTTDSLLINWHADSLGCMGYRQKYISTIFTKYTLATKSPDEIKKILGTPSEEYVNENYHGLRYYCDNTCNGNAMPLESDKCWFEILINNKGETETGYSEVCQ